MKSKLKLIGIILIIVIAFFIHIITSEITSEKEQQDEMYIKMNEIDTSNILVGKSEEEVIEQLGKPARIYTYDDKVYMYSAGKIYKGLIFGHRNFWNKKESYVLYINFDETNKVKSTSMKYLP